MSATLTLRAALRAHPYPCQFINDAGSAAGMLLRVKDTTGLLADSFVARWKGPEALAFCQQHAAELIPGRCVDLVVNRIRAIGDELRADVLSCSLAPLAPSWKESPATPAAHAITAQAATKSIA